MTLYLAGPITGIPDYRARFARGVNLLTSRGYTVLSPTAAISVVPGWTWLDYMRAALRIMLGADGVALLPGWLGSRGARIEALLALLLGLPVRRVGKWK